MKAYKEYVSSLDESEHKRSKEYKKLSPKMKKAIDDLFKKLDSKGSNFLNNFERTIKDVARKNRVPEKKIMDYFEKEATAFMQ